MPQFDFSSYVSQIFWLLLCFAVLYAFTVSYSVPRMRRLLEDRWAKTEGLRLEAIRVQQEAETLVQKVNQDLQMARQQAATKVGFVVHEINTELSTRKQAITHEMKDRYTSVEQLMSQERQAAEALMQERSKSLSQQVVHKLLAGHMTEEEISALLRQSQSYGRVVNGD